MCEKYKNGVKLPEYWRDNLKSREKMGNVAVRGIKLLILRYHNHLSSDVKKEVWTEEE